MIEDLVDTGGGNAAGPHRNKPSEPEMGVH